LRGFVETGVLDKIRQAGGELYGITSEPQSLATEAEEEWELGFPVVGDPHHEILATLREREWIDVYFNENIGHLTERSWASHPKGYYQPAVLAVNSEGRVLYRWRMIPSKKNEAGAGARPEANYIWKAIESAIASGEEPPLDENPVLTHKNRSWFYWMLLALAQGWFLGPKMSPLARAGDKPVATSVQRLIRLYVFMGLWIAALVIFPVKIVGLAFGAWLLAIVPGLIHIHRTLQIESD